MTYAHQNRIICLLMIAWAAKDPSAIDRRMTRDPTPDHKVYAEARAIAGEWFKNTKAERDDTAGLGLT